MAVINIAELYYQYFGIIGRKYQPDPAIVSVGAQDGKYPVQIAPVIQTAQYSALGTPYFQRTKMNGVYLPNEPLITIAGGKNIVKTVIDGRAGTFKELFSLDDYKITIRGFCISENPDDPDEWPEDQIRYLRQVYEEQEPVDIVNDLLTLFGVTQVVVESLEMEGLPGAPGMQPYVMQCLSDKEFDLELKAT